MWAAVPVSRWAFVFCPATNAGSNEERTVNSLYCAVKRRDNRIVSRCIPVTVPHNITLTRRQNVLSLFQDYAAAQLAKGEPAKGLEQAFAAQLEISPSMWSQIKASRPISDKLARQIESHVKKASGWLDEERVVRTERGPDAAEERFMALAREAWRSANAKGKRDLAQLLRGQPRPPRNSKNA